MIAAYWSLWSERDELRNSLANMVAEIETLVDEAELFEERMTDRENEHTAYVAAINAEHAENIEQLDNELSTVRDRLARRDRRDGDARAAEAERQAVIARLNDLPDIWEGLAQSRETLPLQNSHFLDEWLSQGKVEIEYMPFIDLESQIGFGSPAVRHWIEMKRVKIVEIPKIERDEDGNPILDDNDNPIVILETDEYGDLVPDANGNPIPILEKKEESSDRHWRFYAFTDSENSRTLIAEIRLTDEGILFNWEPAERPQGMNDTNWNLLRNRILLSKLRITIDDAPPREVALWDPRSRLSPRPWAFIATPSEEVSWGYPPRVRPGTRAPTWAQDAFDTAWRASNLEPSLVNNLLGYYEVLYLLRTGTQDEFLQLMRR
jgi:hypothetical protein